MIMPRLPVLIAFAIQSTCITTGCSMRVVKGDAVRQSSTAPSPRLFSVRIDGRWGYVTADGSLVISADFGATSGFSCGLAAVYDLTARKWGFIDRTGTCRIEPIYDDAQFFSEGFAAVRKGEESYYIDLEGRRVPEQVVPRATSYIHEGLAVFSEGGKDGFIDHTGRIVIEPRFDAAGVFFDGLAAVEIGRRKESYRSRTITGAYKEQFSTIPGKWGYINKQGDFVIEPRYEGALAFSEQRAGVKLDGKWGFINKSGALVVNPVFEQAQRHFNGLACVVLEGKTGYVDRDGKMVIPPRFSSGRPFADWLAAVEIDGAWGYIDRTGTIVIEPQFHKAFEFRGGLATVWFDKLCGYSNCWGYINPQGKFVWRMSD